MQTAVSSLNEQIGGLASKVRAVPKIEKYGLVRRVVGLVVEGCVPNAAMGDLCEIRSSRTQRSVHAEIVGLRDGYALMIPLGIADSLKAGDLIVPLGHGSEVPVGYAQLGRVLDALGAPLDDGPKPQCSEYRRLYEEPVRPMERRGVKEPLPTGVKAIDTMMTLSRGMRIGIFSGAGVGKSTLLGMILRNSKATVNVVALVGERGREVGEFIEDVLGAEGLKRSVVIVATSDRSPLERVRAAFYATSIAEYFRAQGEDVLFVLDSLTRLGMAQREIGLSVGEPPTTKGYTPTVFSLLPKLLERVCPLKSGGSITGVYTVLVEADDLSDPLADAARSILDGHIVLSREYAERGRFPAINVSASLSRVMFESVSKAHLQAAQKTREIMSVAQEAQDLMNLGAYTPGKNAKFDQALEKLPEVEKLLRQNTHEVFSYPDSLAQLAAVANIKISQEEL